MLNCISGYLLLHSQIAEAINLPREMFLRRRAARIQYAPVTAGLWMPGKKHTSKEIAGKLEQVSVLLTQGKSLSEATKSIGVSRQTFYRWREGRRAGVKSAPKSLRALEEENARLRRLVTDLLLEKMAIEDELKDRE